MSQSGAIEWNFNQVFFSIDGIQANWIAAAATSPLKKGKKDAGGSEYNLRSYEILKFYFRVVRILLILEIEQEELDWE
jgi:hypothetical protein